MPGSVVNIPLQPEFKQCQVPEFAALDPRVVHFRRGQQHVHIPGLEQSPFAAGAGTENVAHEFQEGLKNYRDLNYLWKNLSGWQDSIEVFANMLETRRLAYQERLPEVEAALERADIEGMVDRKLRYDSMLNDIERSNDWLALANKREFETPAGWLTSRSTSKVTMILAWSR